MKAKKIIQRNEQEMDGCLLTPEQFEDDEHLESTENDDRMNVTNSSTLNNAYLFDNDDLVSIMSNLGTIPVDNLRNDKIGHHLYDLDGRHRSIQKTRNLLISATWK